MSDEPRFVPGIELARELSTVVRPIVQRAAPGLAFSLALIGRGSEVLGFDTEMSMDHDWGPRLQVFVPDETGDGQIDSIRQALTANLPDSVRGFSLHFRPPDDADGGTREAGKRQPGEPLAHRVVVERIGAWFKTYLGFDPRQPMTASDWLATPSQRLRSVTAGDAFHDGAGLEAIRARLAWYPDGVWRYLLASSWSRIGEDEHLLGRTGHLGDETGARLLAANIVRESMRLCFLLERQYPPYAKWFGTAFNRLQAATRIGPLADDLLVADGWEQRDAALVALLEELALLQNASGLAESLDPSARQFFGRPFRVIGGERFAQALVATIEDEETRRIAARRLIGGIDQVSDNTNLLEDPSRRAAIQQLYD